jgi:hypothetical protein
MLVGTELEGRVNTYDIPSGVEEADMENIEDFLCE